MKVSLTLAYDGTNFFGSQIQNKGTARKAMFPEKETYNTIFGQLQRVLSQLGINEKVIASGRTDKGVHATGQVCHLRLPPFWSDIKKLKRVLNEMLPSSIEVKQINIVDDEFHARYSAKKRVYRYIIKESASNPFQNNFVTFLNSVNFSEIEKNIKLFIGKYNFKFFMKTGSDVKTTTRVIYKAFAYRHNGYIILNFEGNGYLRSQIRLMVGALLQLNETQIKEQLKCSKNHKIRPVPSNGLYLAKIKY